MSVGNSAMTESGPPFCRSASAAPCGPKNDSGKSRSTAKLSRRTRSLSFSSYASPPPQKKFKRLGCSTCGRSLETEGGTFLYPSYGGGDREGNPVGKTVSKRADAPVIPILDERERTLSNLEELTDAEARFLPSACVVRHGKEETRQHKTSDKVTQWLEDSCQSSVLSSKDIALPVGSSVCSESDTGDTTASSEARREDLGNCPLQCSHSKPDPVADTNSRITSAVPVEVTVPISGSRMTKICGIRCSIRCLKLVVCLPVVLLGLYLKARSNLREQYEPPPT